MPQSPLQDVVSHWHKLIENFSTTALGFYGSVEEALKRRNVPRLKTSRIEWNEGSVLSPRREYLRIYGEHHIFDLCAAPFGNGYFFSSWVTEQKARFVPFFYSLFLVSTGLIWELLRRGLSAFWTSSQGLIAALLAPVANFAATFLLIPVAALIVMWLVAVLARSGVYGPERAMFTVPLIGRFYQKAFAPPTYYRLDTMYMFQSAVQSAVQEVINGLLTAKGLRALNDGEFKPVEKQLTDKRHSIPDAILTAATSN